MSRLNPRTTDPLVGLCGGIGCGKSAAAEYLTQEYGFREYSFAMKLKLDCIALYDIPEENIFGTQAQKMAPLPHLGTVSAATAGMGDPWPDRVGEPWCARWVLEWQGTNACRTVWDPVWLNVVRKAVEHARWGAAFHQKNDPFEPDHRAVISDVRFQNEADMVRDMGGILVRVEQEGAVLASTGHASDGWHTEAEVDFRAIAPKPGLDILYRELDKIMGRYAVSRR